MLQDELGALKENFCWPDVQVFPSVQHSQKVYKGNESPVDNEANCAVEAVEAGEANDNEDDFEAEGRIENAALRGRAGQTA